MEKSFEKINNPSDESLDKKVINRLEKEVLPRFDFIKKLKEKHKEAEIYLVGGATRDILMGREIEDYDFLVRKVEKMDLESFLEKLGEVNFVGRTFGIFKFFPKGHDLKEPVDIALPRQDFSLLTGSRHDFKIRTDPELPIEKDLERRDFTINAIALRIDEGEKKYHLIDVSGGRKDLENGLIKAVGNPRERFKEDYSRILRALRFACQFNFKIEKKTWEEMTRQIKNLNKIRREVILKRERKFFLPEMVEYRVVPHEVIAKELIKSFYYRPSQAFEFYDQAGVFKELMPEVLKMKNCPQPREYHSEGDVWTHTRLALKNLSSKEFFDEFSTYGGSAAGGKEQFGEEKPSSELIFGVLFHDLGKPYVIKTPKKDKTERIRFDGHDEEGARITREICERLKLSSPERIGIDPKRVSWLVRTHMIFINPEIEKIRARTIEKYFFHPYFNGQDLLKLGFVDILSSISLGGKPNFDNFHKMLKRIEEIKNLSASRREAPNPLLSGLEVMEKLSLDPGPEIGKILEVLREEQLSGRVRTREEAMNFLENLKVDPIEKI